MSLLLLSTFITLVNSLCDTPATRTISCTSYVGTASTSNTAVTSTATCKDPATEVLVSCGIEIDDTTNHTSKGIEMTDNHCRTEIDATKSTETPLPIAIARCCNFTSCFPARFDCKLSVKRSRKTANSRCIKPYPHLVSCGFQSKKSKQDMYQGIWYSNSHTNYQMRQDYCTFFNIDSTVADCGTDAPTPSPTHSPTWKPTPPPTKEPTANKPTKTSNPTQMPSQTPSTSPSKTPTEIPTESPTKTAPPTPNAYIYNQGDNENHCTLERDNDFHYLWLYSLCCTNNETATFEPTPQPTALPTSVPSQNTFAPAYNKFSVSSFITWNSPLFPLNTDTPSPAVDPTPQPTVAFTDVDNGHVVALNWGVSNETRTYDHIGKDFRNGIAKINRVAADDYYFTIKKYTLKSGKRFLSEYGKVYVPDCNINSSSPLCICENIPHSIPLPNRDADTIVTVHVYVNDSTNVIEGMTMIRKSGIEYTCHVDMARKKNKTVAFRKELYKKDNATHPENTVDVSACGPDAGLVGFLGTANGSGIDTIQFQFTSAQNVQSQHCPIERAIQIPETSDPTMEPTPPPTRSPLIPSAPSTPTAPIAKVKNAELLFKCYWVMAKESATCDMINTEINTPFMTNCVGYSIDGQPNSWYINQNDECIAEPLNKTSNMVAIATCCHLGTYPPEKDLCAEAGNEWHDRITWTKNQKICKTVPWMSDLFFSISLISVVGILGLWAIAIVFCVNRCRKRNAQIAKQKRLKKKPLIRENREKQKIAIFTKEQIKDRLELERLKVDEDIHREMVQNSRLLSDPGLI